MVVDQADTEEAVAEAIEKEAKAGCTIIFTITSRYVRTERRSALFIRILNLQLSINMSYSSVSNYYAKNV